MKKAVLFILLLMFIISSCTFEEYRQYRVEKARAKNPQWGEETVQKIASRKVEIGMSQDMVTAAMGEPDDVNRQGDVQKWSYAVIEDDGDRVWKRFVYFIYLKDFKVVRIEGDRKDLQYLYWLR